MSIEIVYCLKYLVKMEMKPEKMDRVLGMNFVLTFLVLLSTLIFAFPGSGQQQSPRSSEMRTPSANLWSELLQRTPYPYTLPLAPHSATPIDGTYTKIETKQEPPIPCRRCPDYAPEGGLWKLNLRGGVFRIFHAITGWKDIGSFFVSADQLILANDPVCHEVFGLYRWNLEEGNLTLTVIEDKCAIGLRAMNLTHLPWLSCQPPNPEAATTDHWSKPAGCD